MTFLRSGSDNFRERDLWSIEELDAVYKVQRDHGVSQKALVNALRKGRVHTDRAPRSNMARTNSAVDSRECGSVGQRIRRRVITGIQQD